MVQRNPRNEAGALKAPYVSTRAIRLFFDRVRSVSTPERVDIDRLQDYGVSAGNAPALLSGLKFLGLLDSQGVPTKDFRAIQTTGAEFCQNLEQVVRRAYAEVFERFDVATAERELIRNYFARNYSVSQAASATAVFTDLCRLAEIPLSGALQGAVPRVAERTQRQPAQTRAQSTTRGSERKEPTIRGGSPATLRTLSEQLSRVEHIVEAILERLPAKED